MKPVKIYVWTTCPYCISAENLLNKKNIDYQRIVLDGEDEELNKLRQKTGQRTVPQIFIGDEFIGGASDLLALERSGQLDNKLNS